MYRQILLTVDGSALGRSAIAEAARLASGTDMEVTVLQIVDDLDTLRGEIFGQYQFSTGELARIGALAQDAYVTRRERAEAEVERAAQALRDSGVTSVRTVVREGLAGNEIVDYATAESCDAIVMATRGHGGLGREIVGSVADYVLRHAGSVALVLIGPRSARPDVGSSEGES